MTVFFFNRISGVIRGNLWALALIISVTSNCFRFAIPPILWLIELHTYFRKFCFKKDFLFVAFAVNKLLFPEAAFDFEPLNSDCSDEFEVSNGCDDDDDIDDNGDD